MTLRADPFDVVRWVRRPLAAPAGAEPGPAIEAPASWSRLAVAVVARRYLGRRPHGTPETSIRQLVERVVDAVGGWALAGGQAADADERETLEDQLVVLVLKQRATFATPVWLNAGQGDRPLTSACFILRAEDSIPGLLDWNRREGLIFQQGAGAGVNLSSIRSSREPVSRGGRASGPVSFMRAADAWAATIRSGGRARRGAKMVVLDADHPDILAFVAAKAAEEERGRALARAGWPAGEIAGTLAYQRSNHAVRVSDAFLQRAVDGDDWPLRAVTTGAIVETVPARALLRAIAEAAWACGDPGLLFSSTIDRWHTCPRTGPVTASNPCGEFLHVGDSACNLSALNLRAFLGRERRFEAERFVRAVEALLVAQDAVVDGSGYPSPEVERHARDLRQVGIGWTNLGALLLSLALPYDSDEARAWAAAIAALMTGAAYRRSAQLAAALGPFAEFERNREPMLAVLEAHRAAQRRIDPAPAPRDVLALAGDQWDEALALAHAHGLRNAQTTLIAPTGTTSLMLDGETTGIEPYYALTTVKRLADGDCVRIVSGAVPDALAVLGHSTAGAEQLAAHALDHGHLAPGTPGLRPGEAAVFQTASGPAPLTADAHLGMVAAVQPLLSGGVSKTVNLPAGTGVDEVERVFLAAWRLGLKAVAVYRDGSKLDQPLTTTAPRAAAPAPR
ncbi:MAG TPA: adenosylcobalamin-dependent ribonucleoside-diphosphate reductase [Baekduia sp.]|nr:adenosylcobalamin-dependent ribonucleoside-diphosphate reductase [Baekduia sp.]